jgi:hypothetical protein
VIAREFPGRIFLRSSTTIKVKFQAMHIVAQASKRQYKPVQFKVLAKRNFGCDHPSGKGRKAFYTAPNFEFENFQGTDLDPFLSRPGRCTGTIEGHNHVLL